MMSWMKRIFLFAAVNILVVTTISILLKVFHVEPYLRAYGLNYTALAQYCLIWGMTGSLMSLAMSRMMAKWMMGVQVIDPRTSSYESQKLLQMVHQLSRAAGLPAMPEVGVYQSPEVNAFATGPTKSRALVAVSSGLLQQMNEREMEGVLGHEVSHIANGDMVTMTLLQGVVNAFAMFLSRAISFAVVQALRGNRDDRDRNDSPFLVFGIQMVLEIVFMMLGSLVIAAFSRYREYRADAGGARLAGRDNMIRALQRLRKTTDYLDPQAQPAIQALKISSQSGGLLALFASHPPLEERIERLQSAYS